MRDSPIVRAWGPASLSNLGPGFDALGLCVAGIGDVVEAWRTDALGVQVSCEPGRVDFVPPEDAQTNTAAVAAAAVLQAYEASHGVHLRVRKGIPPGSGIGGSSASAVAGAWAAHQVCGGSLPKAALVEAVLAGEAVASGGRHGDNVLPALLGGLVLVAAADPRQHRIIALPSLPAIALLLPQIQVLTSEARAALPAQVALPDAIHNAAALAFLLEALRRGDWVDAGRWMMQDRLVEQHRARLVPCYDAVREAALAAGAFGCALSGSGPAMFALSDNRRVAAQVLTAMQQASAQAGVPAKGWVTQPDLEGVRTLATKKGSEQPKRPRA